MVDYSGTKIVRPSTNLGDDVLSSDIRSWSASPLSTVLTGMQRTSANSDSWQLLPAPSMLELNLLGTMSPGIGQELFGHIIVWPPKLDLGMVLSARFFTLDVWNTYKRDQRLLSWTVAGLEGITIENADGAPVRYGPGQSRAYTVGVAASGAAQLAGSITFNFAGLPAGSAVNITGSRLTVFSFEPNWREPVVENLEWLTDILTAYNTTEQRLGLRSSPRRSMKFLFTFEGTTKVGSLHSLLWGWMNRAFAVPVWTDWQPLASPVAAGASSITVSTTRRDFYAGGLVLLWRNHYTWEIAEVLTLSSGALALKSPTLSSWAAGDRIIPIRLGRLSKNGLTISRPTSTIAEASVSFSFEVGTAVSANRLGISSWPQFQGLDVLTAVPNATDEASEEWTGTVDPVDFEKGSWLVVPHAEAPIVSRPYSWLLKTRTEIMNFLAFLETRCGMLVPFWMPSWSIDMVQVQDISADDLNLKIRGIGFTKYYAMNANRTALILFPVDNSAPIIKTITGSSEDGLNENISLDTSFGTPKPVGSFKAISFLTYCRMDQDNFELNWHTDSIAECQFKVREVIK